MYGRCNLGTASAARAPLGAFVAVITRRTVIDYYRRCGREPELEGLDSLDWVLEVVGNEHFDIVAGADLFRHVQ